MYSERKKYSTTLKIISVFAIGIVVGTQINKNYSKFLRADTFGWGQVSTGSNATASNATWSNATGSNATGSNAPVVDYVTRLSNLNVVTKEIDLNSNLRKVYVELSTR